MSQVGVALARSPRLGLLAIALSALAGAAVSLALLALVHQGDGHRTGTPAAYRAPGNAFRIDVPAGWSALGPREPVATGSKPVAVLRRDDRSGMVIIRRTSPVKATGAELSRTLGRRLRRRFSGFRAVSANLRPIRGGRAFVYTFVRDPAGTVQSIALVSVRGRAYAIDSVVRADAPGAARQAGAIVASFGP